MVFSRMDRCLQTRQSEGVTTHSIPSFQRQELESMCHELFSWTLSRLSSTKSEQGLTGNFSTQSNLYLERKTQLTITLVGTIQLEKKLLIWYWTGFGSWLIIVLVCKDLSCTILS